MRPAAAWNSSIRLRAPAASSRRRPDATAYYSDGNGIIRMVSAEPHTNADMLTGTTYYRYRTPNTRTWLEFSRVIENGPGLRPLAVDGTANVAYALDKKDGRDALYRVALD